MLLFGSDMLKLSLLSLKSLEWFHIWATHHMTGEMPTENLDGMWKYYPSSKDVMQWDCYGWSSITLEIVRKLLLASMWTELYLLSVGTCHSFWWEQPASIDDAESQPEFDSNEGNDKGFHWWHSVCLGLWVDPISSLPAVSMKMSTTEECDLPQVSEFVSSCAVTNINTSPTLCTAVCVA